MKLLLINVIYFFAAFLLVFLFYVLFINKKVKKNKNVIPMEMSYFIRRFNLNIKRINKNKLMLLIAVTNSFIIAFTSVVTFNIDSLIWRLVVGFAILLTLIYSLYEIEGRVIKRKVSKNDKL